MMIGYGDDDGGVLFYDKCGDASDYIKLVMVVGFVVMVVVVRMILVIKVTWW